MSFPRTRRVLPPGLALSLLLTAPAQAAAPTSVPAGQVPFQPQIQVQPELQYKQPQVRPSLQGTVEARTGSRARVQGAVTLGALRWHCKGSRCTAPGGDTAVSVAACRALAARVGAVTGFGRRAGKQLSAGELKLCNTPLGKAPSYTLDATTGAVRFGDGARGSRPPSGAKQVTRPYRSGGGAPAEGAAAPDKRVPSTLQHRDRAVSAADLQELAPKPPGDVGRAQAAPARTPPAPGTGFMPAETPAAPRRVTTAALRFDGGHAADITTRRVTAGQLRFDGGTEAPVVRRATTSTLRFTGTGTR